MALLLIIDDDAQSSAALAALLRREGHEAACAATAAEALAHLRGSEPDLILLDLTMPRVDGLDLMDALADEPKYEHLRVAVYSGRSDDASRQAAARLGACDYILKGGPWPETYRRIQACLAKAPVDAHPEQRPQMNADENG